MEGTNTKVKNFCLIQLELLKNREEQLRKDILDCKIQREFLIHTLNEIEGSQGGQN